MLDELHFPKRSGQVDEASSVQSLLALAALHHTHGHHKEAVDCLETVMQLAQDMKQEGAVHQALVRGGGRVRIEWRRREGSCSMVKGGEEL